MIIKDSEVFDELNSLELDRANDFDILIKQTTQNDSDYLLEVRDIIPDREADFK